VCPSTSTPQPRAAGASAEGERGTIAGGPGGLAAHPAVWIALEDGRFTALPPQAFSGINDISCFGIY
jgi:hypothetical protein